MRAHWNASPVDMLDYLALFAILALLAVTLRRR